MKSIKAKKNLKKKKKIFAPKFTLSKLTKKITLNLDKTYKKLRKKRTKNKKLKKIKTTAQFKAQQKLREQIAKQKQREKLAKIQVIKVRN